MEIGVEDSRIGLFICKLGGILSAALLIVTLDRKYERIGAHMAVLPIKCLSSPAIDANQFPKMMSYFHALDSTASCYWPQNLQGKAIPADCNMAVPFPVVASFTACFLDKPSSLLFLQSVKSLNLAMRFGVQRSFPSYHQAITRHNGIKRERDYSTDRSPTCQPIQGSRQKSS